MNVSSSPRNDTSTSALTRPRTKAWHLTLPRATIFQLMGFGFVLVALPLVVVLIATIFNVNRIAALSERAVRDAYHVRLSEQLANNVAAMERSLRQFAILGDDSLYQVYIKHRATFLETQQSFLSIPTAPGSQKVLREMATLESALHQQLGGIRVDAEQARRVSAGLSALGTLARSFAFAQSRFLRRDAEQLQQTFGEVRKRLLWQAAALVPVVGILIALIAILLTRPLRAVDKAIRQLGEGDLTTSIAINGPKDVERLGQRLDWLRVNLQALEQQKTEFFRHVSHELRTPLASLREGADLLNEKAIGTLNAEQTEIVSIVRRNGLQLQKLIDDLLRFTAAKAALPFAEQRPVYWHMLIARVIENHQKKIQTYKVVLDTHLPVTVVMGDEDELSVIVANLLSNAIKYSPKGGHIRIELTHVNDTAVLDIADEGPGIDEDERASVFDAFYQGRAPQKKHVKGSGLGLSISQQYVLRHRGRIEIMESAMGAHLRVTLPRLVTGA